MSGIIFQVQIRVFYTIIPLLLLFVQPLIYGQSVTEMLDSARIYADSGDVADVERIATAALETLRTTRDANQLDIADAHYWMGYAQARQRNIEPAKEHLFTALDTYTAHYPPGDQHIGDIYITLANALFNPEPEAGLAYAHKYLHNAILRHGKPHGEIGETHDLIARYHSRQGNYDSVYFHAIRSIEVHLNSDTIDQSELGDSYNSLGWYYENRGNMYEAAKAFEQSDSHYHAEFPPGHIAHSNTYIALSIILQAEHKYEEAISFALKALPIRRGQLGEVHPGTAYCYQLLGILYDDLGEYRKAMYYNRKCIAILDEYNGADNRWSANIYNNQGNSYLGLSMPDSAEYCYRKAFNDNTRILGPDNYEVVYPLKGLGDVFFQRDQPDSALYYFEECYRVCRIIYGDEYRTSIESLIAMAEISVAYDGLNSAAAMIDEAVEYSGFRPQNDLPFSRVSYPVVLLDALRVRALVNYKKYVNSGELQYLYDAYDDIFNAEALITHTRNSFNEVRSKQILAGECLETFEIGIKVVLALFDQTGDESYLDDAFRYCEQNKNLTILEALRNIQAEHFTDIPDSVILELRKMQSRIAQIESELPAVENNSESEMSAALSELKINYYTYLRDVEQSYPRYYALKYEVGTPSLKPIQAWLRKHDTQLIEFFAGDETLTAFGITDDTIIVHTQPIEPVNVLAAGLSARLQDPTSNLTDLMSSADSLRQLILNAIPIQRPSLIAIPDGLLGYIPFATLASVSGRSPKWLAEDVNISYHQSATLMVQEINVGSSSGRLTAFAPIYPANAQLAQLRYSKTEADRVISVFDGIALHGEDATVNAFRKSADEARILHLATHAKADDALGDNAHLVFSPGDSNSLLYVRDLYNIRIPADLAVLSACQTGTGELRRGEGIISMARGFTYAGTKAVVTTLWPVNDEVTAGIMETFYTGIRNGAAKHTALTGAQRTFLASLRDPQLAHPYYWAPYILIGDTSPVDQRGASPWLILIAAGLLVLIFQFIRRPPLLARRG